MIGAGKRSRVGCRLRVPSRGPTRGPPGMPESQAAVTLPGPLRPCRSLNVMRFGPVDAVLDLPALEERVLARWRENDVVEQVARIREGAKPWVFYEGPPTANGRPGLHHVWARAFK